MLAHINIGKRLGGGFLLAVLITLLTGLTGFIFIDRVGGAGIYVGESAAPLVDAVMEAKLLATETHLKFEELMGGNGEESMDNVRKLLKEARWFITAIGAGGRNDEGTYVPIDNPAGQALVKTSLEKFDAFSAALEARYAARQKGQADDDSKTDTAFDAYLSEIDKLEGNIQDDVKASLRELRETVARSKTILLMLVAVALVLGMLLGRVITVSITHPLDQCVALAKEIESGNLTVSLTPTGSDEIAQLVGRLESMRLGLLEIIGAMRGNVDCLNRSATALTESATESERTSSAQSAAASSMAAAVEELSVSIDQIGDHARTASSVAEESGRHSAESSRVIQNAAGEMSNIAAAVNGTADTIRELEGFSGQISHIINVIKEIADQTNLLALNAAIEAARAGEQGRGFAVVADEVRKLAERTASSTQEIATVIGKIQEGTRKAVEEMEAGVQKVDAGVELANRAGASVTDIRNDSDQVTRVVSDITLALSEQSSATREIAQRVEQIAQSADHNRNIVTDTATAARELAELAKRLDQLATRFRIA